MKPQRKVRDDDGARLGTAERDLVIRLGICARRVQADDRHPLGRAAPQVFAAEIDRPAHDRNVDARPGEQVIQVLRTRNDLQTRFAKSPETPHRADGRLAREASAPSSSSSSSVTENHNVHRENMAPMAF